MAKTVLIGSKLPNGLIIDTQSGKKAEINGLNKAVIIGATFVTTQIDAETWAEWTTQNPDYPALKHGFIFEAANQNEAAAKAKDTDKTGLEPMPQKALGVETSKD